MHRGWCICCSSWNDERQVLCTTAGCWESAKIFSLLCKTRVMACWFFSVVGVSVTCPVKWPGCYCRDLPSLFTWLCYLSYMSWIKTQRKFNKMKSAFACIFHQYWLLLLVRRLDSGPANLPWEGECGLQAQSRERRRDNPLSHRQCGTACPI